MRTMSACQASVLALALIHSPSICGATDSELKSLTPFVGETAKEFEARKRGLTLEEDRRSGALTIAADRRGHFFVEPLLQGRQIRMLVDTGASLVALSYEDAQNADIRVSSRDFTRKVSTANGVVDAAPVRIGQIQLGDIIVRDIDAIVLPSGSLDTSLLGMSFLSRLTAFEIAEGRLALRQ